MIHKMYCLGIPEISHINHQDPEWGGWCDECKQFIECQKANRNPPKILTLTVKKRYYDEILAGTKTTEYRHSGATILITIGERLAYPYQAMEKP